MTSHLPIHTWLKHLFVSYVPGPSDELSLHLISELINYFQFKGHTIQDIPSKDTNVIITTAKLEEPLNWREALMFTARRRYKLKSNPSVFTIIHAHPEELNKLLLKIKQILDSGQHLPNSFQGVPESAYQTLYEQGKRGGLIMYLLRVLQAQALCARILLLIGKNQIESAYLFDLVGAYPFLKNSNEKAFIKDIALRIETAASTKEITNHLVKQPRIDQVEWQNSSAVKDMILASNEFGNRGFFTEMIQVSKLAKVPGISEAISQQYSEGCFATWDIRFNGLVTTITGGARPVRKNNITDKYLAVITGIKPEEDGAVIREIEGHPNFPPSSEAVEMIGIDLMLPKIQIEGGEVPVIRSKLHGHRGVQSFNNNLVEYVPLSESYLYYPVSCSTDAQYKAVREAFSTSSALQDPQDPRKIVFTILPGHGVVLAEKWVKEKRPFQLIWEALDNMDIEISNFIPQGPFVFDIKGQHSVISDNNLSYSMEY